MLEAFQLCIPMTNINERTKYKVFKKADVNSVLKITFTLSLRDIHLLFVYRFSLVVEPVGTHNS